MKPTYNIEGNVMFPVKKGFRAYIQTVDNVIHTSLVVNIIKQDDSEVAFETKNSIYKIKPFN